MSTHEAANGFVSGELLLRSDENDDRCLPPALEKRLRDSLRGRVARSGERQRRASCPYGDRWRPKLDERRRFGLRSTPVEES